MGHVLDAWNFLIDCLIMDIGKFKDFNHYVIYMCIEMGWKMEAHDRGKPLKDSKDVQ